MGASAFRDRFLRLRGGRRHYFRRGPERFAPFDARGTIRVALDTDSAGIVRRRRDDLAAADEAFWSAMSVLEGPGERSASEVRYRQARAAALAAGFSYKPLAQLVSQDDVEDVVRRLLTPDNKARAGGELLKIAHP